MWLRRTQGVRTGARAPRRLALALAALALLAARGGQAATITAIAPQHGFVTGQTIEIDIVLDLGPGEVASVFEGRFDLVGAGSVVESLGPGDVLAGGPTWDPGFGGMVAGQLVLSLTSSNTGGSRLVAKVSVTGLAAGVFQIRLASGTFAQRDIASPPFVQDVPITTPVGTVLASLQVNAPQVPALGPLAALALASAILEIARRSRR